MYKLTILVGLVVLGVFTTPHKQQSFAENRLIIPQLAATMTTVISPEVTVRERLPKAAEVRGLSIEAINLDIPLDKTTLGKNQELLVPANPNKAAWYKSGPKFGEAGTALVTGHLDSMSGPGVFWNLKKLVPGDLIYAKRDDGKIVTYQVDKLESYAQDMTFPWDKVYATTGPSSLRIITCDGKYDPKTARYSHNLVVYASVVN
ncbi:MAG: hypothetical protein A3I07_01245 [Candidatus Doudnabacteria bacterium RIFCSPLOWO2_02_FULL_42_9]|uniref:Class F sortase n=1 Tax=Candidatus Doudnabacteria bacterium RIFCSPHIGHO2_01_FULL_41_86 TaxID=1817821 RepID=A0A1F5N8V2_9BACT|nr:MAG: hypothetical protein A2717_00810 [Candidatus Doudnabacteria bacterium RIFCSPHIGHO2_01_FULL_41_86]OGE75385.1 MAG: hypothetical protein A3K07_01325 [Candidatus Doudnabacteria bacterium RIFCSPHIGHO2_01_43_10]OGE86589.1 MAG: hypothetical protein A3E28_04245 [Candidatus Doudnabacteria bacterium RIFCSPHIGHO2_12_FULL_42_22]OGE87489.1 MAG: hypothetical protein A3C49_03905 [Candidatus Doudnabacteria bacterium RIFCSPHIGHO2_02_FULL_42_25]OGE92776.1 MAG: hypothetical protein A2895_04610 [Candidatus